jgi:hypothetical protein
MLELGDPRREIHARRSAFMLFDLFEASFSRERPPSKTRELGREVPNERIQFGERELFSWCVV